MSTTPLIHPSSFIASTVQLGKNVQIGPFTCIEGEVIIGDDVRVHSHVSIAGRTNIGARTQIFPFASIGHVPQDLKYHGELSQLHIGTDNIIREYVTMQPGTEGGGMLTSVGNHCLFMAGSHVAHDCRVGDHVILANNATLAGHVSVGDYVIVGGLSAIHQFVRIGAHAMIGGMSGVEADVIPFGVVLGERAKLSGLNLIGLKRRGFAQSNINGLREAYRGIFTDTADNGNFMERVKKIQSTIQNNQQVTEMITFITQDAHRNICLPKQSA